MTTGHQNMTGTEDKPLTRSDVEQLLREAGSSEKLNLSGRNLNGIDLLAFDLTGANLRNANLGGAILREAVLVRVNMRNADLRQVDLVKANLRGADLRGANLFGSSMGLADLTGADLSQANLTTVTLSRANLSGAILRDAILTLADLSRANLRGADLRGADLLTAILSYSNLSEAQLAGAHLSEDDKNHLREMGIQISEEYYSGIPQEDQTLRIRILEEPLTALNLALIISNLTELTTKLWLISKGRFADLIEYVQTRNNEFAEEAHTIVSSINHNSPMNMDWKVDISAPGIAEAIVAVIDGTTQVRKRLDKVDLDIQAKKQELKQAEQRASRDKMAASIEEERLRLEVEQRRLEVLEKRLEVQKKGIDYAFEIASKVVDTLHPAADPATRAMEIQALLPNLLQLQNGRGLELALNTKQEDNH